MATFLTITLAVLLVACIWLLITTARKAHKDERKLQESIDDFNKATEAHIAELQGAKHRVSEAIAETAKIKACHEELLAEHEELVDVYKKLKENYEKLNKENEELVIAYKDLRAKYEATLPHTFSGDPHAGHQDPVNGGDVNVVTTTAGEKRTKQKCANTRKKK